MINQLSTDQIRADLENLKERHANLAERRARLAREEQAAADDLAVNKQGSLERLKKVQANLRKIEELENDASIKIKALSNEAARRKRLTDAQHAGAQVPFKYANAGKPPYCV